MSRYNNHQGRFLYVFGIAIVGTLILVGFISCQKTIGIGGWGPTETVTITVTEKKIDISGGKERASHYMVYGTVNGVVKAFEVDNGFLLGIWNADEVYAGINVGTTYEITTKGKKRVNWFLQEYPYIVNAILEPANSITFNKLNLEQ